MLGRLKQFGQDLERREFALLVFTGLVVTWVRHGLQHHWKGWDSWGDFFAQWFVHTLGVLMLLLAAGAAIIWSHKFFLGYEKKEYGRELMFYIVMTILVAALCIAFVALKPPSDDYEDSSVFIIFSV